MVRTKRCEMNISENAGSSWRTPIIADFSARMISHSVIAAAVAKCRGLPGQAPLSAEIVRTHDRNNGFLPLLGNDGDLDPALLDVEHRIRRITLRENNV